MRTYEVVLAKSYTVEIKADDAEKAKHFAEFYTNDIADISEEKDRKRFNFSIEKIECGVNESLGAEEKKD